MEPSAAGTDTTIFFVAVTGHACDPAEHFARCLSVCRNIKPRELPVIFWFRPASHPPFVTVCIFALSFEVPPLPLNEQAKCPLFYMLLPVRPGC